LLPGLGEVFPPIPPQNSAIWQNIPFSGFLLLCIKISFWQLFMLNKFVFNTPNKNYSQAKSLCSAVNAIGLLYI
jgi:hypothetical protein